MVVVQELGILLEADPSGLEEGLDRANQKLKSLKIIKRQQVWL